MSAIAVREVKSVTSMAISSAMQGYLLAGEVAGVFGEQCFEASE